jgi:hypothetical protein
MKLLKGLSPPLSVLYNVKASLNFFETVYKQTIFYKLCYYYECCVPEVYVIMSTLACGHCTPRALPQDDYVILQGASKAKQAQSL